MGTVKTTWLLPGHSGRACHHEEIYTKQDKKTSKVYSVKLCNPNDNWTEEQIAHRASFGAISTALAAWIKTNSVSTAANYQDYLKVKKQYDRQTKYSTLRGMMYAKGMYTISDDGTVTVDITANTSNSGGGSTVTKYTLNLAASPSNGGTVSGAGSYAAGTAVSIKATANSGYTFSRWSDGNTSASRSVTVTANQTLTAVFTANSSEGGGGQTDTDGQLE